MRAPRVFAAFPLVFYAGIALSGCAAHSEKLQAQAFYSITAPGLNAPYTGRIYVVVAPEAETAPIYTDYWFSPIQIHAVDVTNWDGDTPVQIRESDLHFKRDWPEDTQNLAIQAVTRNNKRHWHPLIGVGNYVSAVSVMNAEEFAPSNLQLELDSTLTQEWNFWAQSEKTIPQDIEHFALKSSLLSEFHGTDYYVNVSVQLPSSYHEREDWPVLFYISGMGGSELEAVSFKSGFIEHLDEVIIVSADAMNFYGHSVFANSSIKGPWRDFFVKELVPEIHSNYKANDNLYLTGISSGGWSSLWLQLHHPDVFDGTWSFVPDPVDFRDFLQVDLYDSDANLFVDSLGDPRPAARSASTGEILFTFRQMAEIENVLGPGAQLGSLNAVFGVRDENENIVPYFDVNSGEVNAVAIENWKEYDIRLMVREIWPEKSTQYLNKINIIAGQYDNFYLEGAVELLQEEFARFGNRDMVKILADHGHAFDEETIKEMAAQIAENEQAEVSQ